MNIQHIITEGSGNDLILDVYDVVGITDALATLFVFGHKTTDVQLGGGFNPVGPASRNNGIFTNYAAADFNSYFSPLPHGGAVVYVLDGMGVTLV